MKILKRLLKVSFLLLFLIVVAAIAIPYFFKDQIVEKVKTDINKNFNATIDFTDVDLSLLKSFPNFNFGMDQFSIVGKDEFEGIHLVDVEKLQLTFDLMSVIKSDQPIEIRTIDLEKPKLNIQVLRNGKANYDIVKATTAPTTEETTSSEDLNFLVKLKKYSIANGNLIFNDKSTNTFVELVDLNHNGTGKFTQDVYDFYTKTNFASLTTKSGGVKYLNRAKGDLDITFNADMRKMRFTLKENELQINALKVKADGFFEIGNSEYNMDLTFDAPSNDFKNFLSLIPSAYTKDYDDVKANGQLKFNGFVKGTYNDKGQMPAYKINLDIADADVKYPDLPLGISQINTKVLIDSPSSDPDKMKIDIPAFRLKIGEHPFEGVFKLRHPISDPDIDAKMKGTIDLAELVKAFPMEGVEQLSGIITTDMQAKTRLSAIEKEDYENIDMNGDFQIQQVNYKSKDMPDVKINDMALSLSPKYVQVNNFDAKLGKSDIQATGRVDNILAYFSPEKTMKGDLTVQSNYFDANEWLAEDESVETEKARINTNDANAETSDEAVFDRFDFTVDADMKKIVYDEYILDNLKAKGNFTPNDFTINNFQSDIGESDIQASGKITNVFNYLYDDETLGGRLNLKSKFLNLNQFMTEEDIDTQQAVSATPTSIEDLDPFLVPKNIDLDVDANFDRLLYTDIELRNVKGKLDLEDEEVALRNIKAKGLGGDFTMNGAYNTQDAEKPNFNLKYDVKRLNFKSAFDKLNTFQQLAPIGKFINGSFNTDMAISGVLGKDMMPVYSSLNAAGFLQTINGVVKNFEPLEKLADKLNIKKLKSLDLSDTKNWFEIKNGMVEIKEFDYSYQGIDMKIGGKHSIEQDMDYLVKAKIPRELLENNAVGAAADKGIDLLKDQASKYGIDIKKGKYININANILGSATNPKIKIKVVGSEGESMKDEIVDNIKDQVKDRVTEVANEKVDEAKVRVKKETDKVVGEAKKELSARAKKAAELAREKAEKELGEEAAKIGDKVSDEAKKKAEEALGDEADKIKDKLDDWNPFGKKKKDGE